MEQHNVLAAVAALSLGPGKLGGGSFSHWVKPNLIAVMLHTEVDYELMDALAELVAEGHIMHSGKRVTKPYGVGYCFVEEDCEVKINREGLFYLWQRS